MADFPKMLAGLAAGFRGSWFGARLRAADCTAIADKLDTASTYVAALEAVARDAGVLRVAEAALEQLHKDGLEPQRAFWAELYKRCDAVSAAQKALDASLAALTAWKKENGHG